MVHGDGCWWHGVGTVYDQGIRMYIGQQSSVPPDYWSGAMFESIDVPSVRTHRR